MRAMPSGGPGDHPISDITTWELPHYGKQADSLIRQIARLCSRRELYEWWEKEIGGQALPGAPVAKSAVRYEQLVERARLGGWEMPAEHGP